MQWGQGDKNSFVTASSPICLSLTHVPVLHGQSHVFEGAQHTAEALHITPREHKCQWHPGRSRV